MTHVVPRLPGEAGSKHEFATRQGNLCKRRLTGWNVGDGA
jgi:hypothetical protein